MLIPDLTSNILVLIGVSVNFFFLLTLFLPVCPLFPSPLLVAGAILFAKRIRPNFRKDKLPLAKLNAAPSRQFFRHERNTGF
jgi:hypothetical protein